MDFIGHRIEVDDRIITLSIGRSKSSTRALIIGPAMGVKSSFYHSIAEFFYHQDFNCILVDYHGMFYENGKHTKSDIASSEGLIL